MSSILSSIFFGEDERWLNNKNISNKNEETQGNRENGEKPLVNNPVEEDTKCRSSEDEDGQVSYWHKKYRNAEYTAAACKFWGGKKFFGV